MSILARSIRVRIYFGNYSFFLWFQLEVETFQVGAGCPCRGVGLKKKNSCSRVGGGRAQRLPLRCIRRTCCAIRLRLVEFWGPCVHNFCRFAGRHLVPLGSYLFVSCVHEGLGPLGSYLFWGLRFFGALGALKIWCCLHKFSLNSAKFLGLTEVLFFLLVSCV